MSKSKAKTQSTKKRKREKNATTLSILNDQQIDRKHQDASDRKEPSDQEGVYTKRKDKKRKKRSTKVHTCNNQKSSRKVAHGQNNNRKIDGTKSFKIQTPTLPQQQDEGTPQNRTKEKEKMQKKRKQKKKRALSPSSCLRDCDENQTEAPLESFAGDKEVNENALEGALVSDVLVLIDRKARKVYSATADRLQNGDRKEVGRLDKDGQVVLFPMTEKVINDSISSQENDVGNNKSDDENSSIFPYKVDPDDHCESPLNAYKDIVVLLKSYERRIRKEPMNQLSIYDPYFCNGRVVRHLESLGFPNVYNRKEDCYKVWKDPSLYPSYDMFLTNPPYSADHIEKLMRHVTSKRNKNKPWMLLMPNFVHKKDYFQQLTTDTGQQPIYLVPRKRYVYQPPPNMREKKASSTHKKSAPFVSIWYLWGGSRELTDEWYAVLRNQHSMAYDIARSKSALRDLRRKPKKK